MNSKILFTLIAIFSFALVNAQDCEIIELAIENVTCNGFNDGKIVLDNTTSCAPPVTYSWAHGASGSSINNLSPGLYELTLTDAMGFQIEKNWLITEPNALIIDASVSNIICNGQEDGSISIFVNEGTFPYTYQWSNGATTPFIFDLSEGNYSVTVTDDNFCTISASYSITDPDPVSINVDLFNNISCSGENDGHIIVSGQGGTTDSGTSMLDYYYEWSTGEFGVNEIDNLSPGTYTVTVSDFYFCSEIMSFSVFDPSDIFVTFPFITNLTCNNDASGSIQINAGGGTGTLTYSWSNGASGSSNDNLQAGTYALTITDENECTFTDSYTVNEPLAIVESPADVFDLDCFEDGTGEIEVFFSGGTGTLAYLWSNGATTSDLANLPAGLYNLTVTDDNDCQFTNTYTVNEPSEISVTNPTIINVDCFENQNGSIEIFPTGGTPTYSYTWSNGETTNIISNLNGGFYSLTITDDNGCTFIDTYNVSEPNEIIVTNPTITDVDCFGDQNGSIEIFPTGGTPNYSYAWSNGETTNIISNLDGGFYSLTITDDNGCIFNDTYNVFEPNEIIVTNPTIIDVDCFDNQNGSIEIFPTGGTPDYTYSWSNGETTNILSNLAGGPYSLTISDENGCTFTETYIITEPSEIIITNTSITNVDCFGNQNGSIELTIEGGTPGYMYAWSNGATSSDISELSGGAYTITITDTNGCSHIETLNISEPSEITAGVDITEVECGSGDTGSITLTMSGGAGDYTYEWSNGETSNSISELASGNFSVTVQDADNCTFIATYFVAQPGDIEIVSVEIENNTCPEDESGTIDLQVTGGEGSLTFNWSNGSTTSAIENLNSGLYGVTISDENDCNLVEEYEISGPSPLQTEALQIESVDCFGGEDGSISFLPSGGPSPFLIEWTYVPFDGGQAEVFESIDVTGTISHLFGSGSVDIKITDANSCLTELETISINQPEAIIYSTPITDDPKCSGDTSGLVSFIIDGGASPYSVEWTYTPQTGGETFVKWTYNVTDTVSRHFEASTVMPIITDANGCSTQVETILINDPESIAYSNIEVSSPSCANDTYGIASFQITGGASPYSVEWTYIPQGGEETFIKWTYNVTEIASNNFPSAVVTPKIIDTNGCEIDVDNITIAEPALFEFSTLSTNDALCYGDTSGQVSFEIAGGLAPFIIEWTYTPLGSSVEIVDIDSNQSGMVNRLFGAGIVDIYVEDVNGCFFEIPTQSISVKNEIKVEQLDIEQPKCGEDSSGVVSILLSGGASPYAIEWTYMPAGGSETFVEWTYNITGLEKFNFGAGIISANIVDADGCAFQLEELLLENIDGAQINEIKVTYTDGLGNIELIMDSPVGDLTFSWTGPNGFSSSEQNLTKLEQGSYSCIVTDSNGCQTLTGGIDIIITSVNEINSSDFITVNTISTETLLVHCKTDQECRMIYLDLNGQHIFSQDIHSGDNTIDVSHIPSGLYVIILKVGKDTFSQLISKF